MKNLQIWGTGWAASWAFFKVIEKTQGMTNISFRIMSFGSANIFVKTIQIKDKLYDYVSLDIYCQQINMRMIFENVTFLYH